MDLARGLSEGGGTRRQEREQTQIGRDRKRQADNIKLLISEGLRVEVSFEAPGPVSRAEEKTVRVIGVARKLGYHVARA